MIDEPPVVWITACANSSDRSERRTVGRALAMRLLMAMGGSGWAIETDARGKPVARGPAARHVSIAHSRNIIAAAASAVGPVGIDIEYLDPKRDVVRLAHGAYGIQERRAVALFGASAFYRIWTLREAIGKATGDGMTLVADRVDRVPASLKDGAFSMAPHGWLLGHDVIARDFSLALAVHVSSPDGRRLEGLAVKSARWQPQ